jgi:hypothetical protein
MPKRATILPEPRRGDLVAVVWQDFTSEPTGKVEEATPALCITSGFFYGLREEEIMGQKRTFLITTLTIQVKDADTAGFDTYPMGEVLDIRVVVPREEVKEWASSLLLGTKEEIL